MYQLITESKCIKRLADNAFIPNNENNVDYQAYLKWLDGYELVGREWVQTKPEGNTPLPADIQE